MKKKLYIIIILFSALSCNKEKRYSKKLIKGETWNVESIIVNDNLLNSNTISANTLVFDNTITQSSELSTTWKQPLQSTWWVKYLN